MAEEETGGFAHNISVVPKAERIIVARLRNTVSALAKNGIMLWDTSLSYGYDAASKFEPQELLKQDVMKDVAQVTRHQLELVAVEK